MPDFAAKFPILDRMTFLNHAATAPLSGPAAEAFKQYAQYAATHSYVGSGCYEQLDELRADAGRLINARGGHEIAFVPNTATGIALVAQGLPWREDDEVVLSNVEFPANRYPWDDLKRRGVKVVEVAQRPDYRIDEDDVINAITDRTRVVAISHVQFSTGFRIDLKRISEVAHQAGAYLCVDAIQSVGVLPVDVQAMGVDFLSADGHKWMLGPEGAGIFYCHEDLIEALHPALIGWTNMVDPMDFLNYKRSLRKDAQRFEPGTRNIPGLLALHESIKLLLDAGAETVWSRIDALNQQVRPGLQNKGYKVLSPPEPQERSGIVAFTPGDASVNVDKIAADLESQDIIIAVRNGRLRVSPHFYNKPEQIERFLAALP